MSEPTISPSEVTITWPDGSTLPVALSVTGAPTPPTNKLTSFSHTLGQRAPQTTMTSTPGTVVPPTPPPPPPAGTVLFDGTQYAAWALDQSAVIGGGPNSRVQEVADPAGISGNVLQFTTFNTDTNTPQPGNLATPTDNPRSQLVAPSNVLQPGETYWNSFEMYIPVGSPLVNTTGWVAHQTALYGEPFAGGSNVGISTNWIASDSTIGPNGVYTGWQVGDDDSYPGGYYWVEPVTSFVGKWTRFTWQYTISESGVTDLYLNSNLVKSIPVGGIDGTDNIGPWTPRLMLYYQLNQFPQATVFYKGFKIATTQAAAEG